MTELGFPFIKEPIELEKDFWIEKSCNRPLYYFEAFCADCAKIFIDETDVGFYWNGKENRLNISLSAGKHHLRMFLYPSTFNCYGPHNHIDGDVRICSPAQFTGEKNFADRIDAPNCTRTSQIHVKKFGVGDLCVFE